jgi:hypothetical protein
MEEVDTETQPWGNSQPTESADEAGPRQPSNDVRHEVEALLEADDTRLGEVYLALQRGLSAEAIAAELEVASSNFVWNYHRIIRAMLDGDLPRAPSVALSAARKFRTLLKSPRLSLPLRSYLEANLAELERRADDQTARAQRLGELKSRRRKRRRVAKQVSTSTPCHTTCDIRLTQRAAVP